MFCLSNPSISHFRLGTSLPKSWAKLDTITRTLQYLFQWVLPYPGPIPSSAGVGPPPLGHDSRLLKAKPWIQLLSLERSPRGGWAPLSSSQSSYEAEVALVAMVTVFLLILQGFRGGSVFSHGKITRERFPLIPKPTLPC